MWQLAYAAHMIVTLCRCFPAWILKYIIPISRYKVWKPHKVNNFYDSQLGRAWKKSGIILGSTFDISAFSDILKKSTAYADRCTVIADTGFACDDDFTLLGECGLNYVVPLKRGTRFVKGHVPASPFGYEEFFSFNGSEIHRLTIPEKALTSTCFLIRICWHRKSQTLQKEQKTVPWNWKRKGPSHELSLQPSPAPLISITCSLTFSDFLWLMAVFLVIINKYVYNFHKIIKWRNVKMPFYPPW